VEGTPRVVIIGGGAAAASLSVRLARMGLLARIALTIVDPAERIGRGLAYASHPAHRLNVPAARMGLDARDVGGFHAYALERGVDAAPNAFLPRVLYGAFVEDTLTREVAPYARHVRARATGAARLGLCWRVALDDGGELEADAVVLATGNAPPARLPGVSDALHVGSRYIPSPWLPEAFDGVGPDDAVFVIGTGLTAVDACVTLRTRGHRGRLTLLSRRGLLPRPHAHAPAAHTLPALPEGGDLRAWMRLARTEAERAVARGAPWQGVFDALRAHVPAIWASLDAADRARFLRHARPYWDVHRHRVPPDLLDMVETAIAEGRAERIAGRVVSAGSTAEGVRVTLRRRGAATDEVREAHHLVNATGPDLDLRRSGGPLLRTLLAEGLLAQDLLRTGLMSDTQGSALGADGRPVPGLYVLGGARRATEWEATAMHEVSGQAERLAERLRRLIPS
jgi:uncharacterized NAD(P)/FAD-binding protein YdhS